MPTGAMTLLELAKTMPEGPEAGIIGTYATAYQPMSVMPLQSAIGGVWKYTVEDKLPYEGTGTGARNFNSSFSATRSAVSPKSENIRIYGGRTQIDRMMVEINPAKVPQEKASQVKALAKKFVQDMFEGAGGTYLRGISDVLDNDPLFANQTVDAGTVSTGARLETDDLDAVLNKLNVTDSTYLYVTDNVGLRARKISRGVNVTGDNATYQNRFDSMGWGTFGGTYQGVPIIVLKDGKGNDLLSTTDGDGSSSSVYGVTYGVEMFTGFQSGPMKVINLDDNTSYNYFDLEHGVGTAAQGVRCIARIRYVTDAV